jgi:hypothetical protein
MRLTKEQATALNSIVKETQSRLELCMSKEVAELFTIGFQQLLNREKLHYGTILSDQNRMFRGGK